MLTEDQIGAICARHAATIGMSGSGKTFTEKGYVEWLLERKRHTVIIDPLGAWWGLRSSVDGEGDGFPIPIFGGEHGDVEIGIWDGAAVADVVLRDSASCIIDLSGFRTGSDQRMFMEGFIGGLRGKPKATLNLIVDEADEFAPETVQDKVGNRLKEDMVWIAKRGRLSGFILHIITQRPADIAKSVLTQCQSLTVHQLIAPQDQKPAEDWLKGKGDKVTLRAVMDTLASLETGERWVYSPKAKILDHDTSPPIRTFDSSRSPEPGETLVEAKTLAQLDVSAIRGALKKPPEAVPPAARAEELELAHQRLEDMEGRVQVLTGQLSVAATEIADAVNLLDDTIGDLINIRGPLVGAIARAQQGLPEEHQMSLEQFADQADELVKALCDQTEREEPPKAIAAPKTLAEGAGFTNQAGTHVSMNAKPGIDVPRQPEDLIPEPAWASLECAAVGRPADDAVELSKKARDFVELLDRISPARVTWAQLAVMVGGTASGGTFNTAKRQLQASGLIVQDGKFVRSAKRSPAGMSRAQAVSLWRSVLPAEGRTRDMFDVLVAAVNPMTKEEIADAIGIAPRGGNFSGSFAPLNQNELVEKDGSAFRLVTKLPGEK